MKMCKAVYIHIPFCKTICSYCDFCKVYYSKKNIKKYLEQLEMEIRNNYRGELIETIYIGGGTPSCLDIEELVKLFEIVDIFHKSINLEFTIECNIETLTEKNIKLFCKNKINRISVGVQSLLNKNIEFLERHHDIDMVQEKISLLNKYEINNINLDLIYALPNQSLEDLRLDLDEYLKLGINHISTYSLMIEPNTKLSIKKIKPISEELDRNMYDFICDYLKNRGFKHYEISNFCLPGSESKHNLTYWNNENYYGFGVGASGYIETSRYDNTRSITKYLSGDLNRYIEQLSYNEILENEFILGFRKVEGISKKEFKNKYNREICDIIIVKNLLKSGKLEDNGEYIFIKEKYLYISNSILLDFIGGNYE